MTRSPHRLPLRMHYTTWIDGTRARVASRVFEQCVEYLDRARDGTFIDVQLFTKELANGELPYSSGATRPLGNHGLMRLLSVFL